MNIKFSFDETNVQVGFENQFVIKDMTEDTLVKILMLKGEKGDTVSGQWGTIIGNLADQTDLKNALDSKASASDLSTTNSNVATNTSNISALSTQVATNTSNIGINTNNIATNTAAIEDNADDIADLQTQVGTNTSNIATNTSNIATNTSAIATNTSNIASNTADIGGLNNLTTTDKTSLVNAVNEINVPSKWVSVGSTAPTNGERVWFKKSKNLISSNVSDWSNGNWSSTTGQVPTIGSSNSRISLIEPIKVTPNTTYYIKVYSSNDKTALFRLLDADKKVISTITALKDTSWTAPNNCHYICVTIYENVQIDVIQTGAVQVQLELGSTATSYEPSSQKEIYVDNEHFTFDNYSASEQIIGKWIDGKPLYRKAIYMGAMPNNAQGGTKHNIANIDMIITARIIMTNGTNFIPAPSGYPSNTSLDSYVYADKNYIYIRTGTDRSSYNGYGILEYTKTTD